MTRESEIELFRPLLVLRADPKMAERLDPVTNFQQAAEIRGQAERIKAMAERLCQPSKKETVWGIAGELAGVKESLMQIEKSLRETFTLLVGLVNREFSAGQNWNIPLVKATVEAYFWRSRIIGDLFSASTCYKLTAELLSLSMKTLGQVSLSAESGESSLLLNHTAALVVDAAKQMGTAGTELGDCETHWQNLEGALNLLE